MLVALQRTGDERSLPAAAAHVVELLRSWGPGPQHLTGLALAGLTVPVRLVGPFDGLKYQVDYAAAASQLVRSKAGERIRGALEERLGISKPAAGGEQQAAPGGNQSGQGGSAIDKLKGLLGR